MRKLILIIAITLPSILFGQNFQIEGKIRNLPLKTVYLLSYYGDRLTPVDSVKTSLKGEVKFVLKPDTPIGLYRLAFGRNKAIDLMFNYESIKFELDVIDPENTIEIIQSNENKLYHEYLQNRNYNQFKLELLQPLLAYYPITDTFFVKLKHEYNQIQNNYEKHVQGVIKTYPESFAAKIIALDRKPSVDPELPPMAQQAWLRAHYFDDKGEDFSQSSVCQAV